jgi:hypothetical protein
MEERMAQGSPHACSFLDAVADRLPQSIGYHC